MRTETLNPCFSRWAAFRMPVRRGPGFDRRRSAHPRVPALPAIPATFNANQGRLILDLRAIAFHAPGDDAAAAVLRSLRDFSVAQLVCIGHLLRLDRADFLATLADALEPCELRDLLRAGVARDSFFGLVVETA